MASRTGQEINKIKKKTFLEAGVGQGQGIGNQPCYHPSIACCISIFCNCRQRNGFFLFLSLHFCLSFPTLLGWMNEYIKVDGQIWWIEIT